MGPRSVFVSVKRQSRAGTWGLVIGLIIVGSLLGWHVMIRMPGESYQGPLPPMTEEQRALAQELRDHVHRLAGEIGERNMFRYSNLVKAGDYIRERLGAAGYRVKRHTYEVSGHLSENLEAEVPGTDRPAEILLIGAHYDSVRGSPGANDNASGVAALLTLARSFAQTSTQRTLRFVAFTNEEPPFFKSKHMGSRVYAKQSRDRGEHVLLMLSLETIGYYSDERWSQWYPVPFNFFYPSTGNFLAFVSNIKNGRWVRQLVASFRQHAQFPSEGGALWGLIPGISWSDHWAFWKEGYPAVMLTDTALFRYPAYHSSADTPDKIQYERLARVVSGLRRVIAELANAPSDRK